MCTNIFLGRGKKKKYSFLPINFILFYFNMEIVLLLNAGVVKDETL